MKTKSLYPILVSEDIEATIKFYSTFFDYTVKHDHKPTVAADAHVMVLSNPNGDEIELIEKTAGSPPSILAAAPGILGLRINVDDIEEAKKEAEKNGCKFVSPIFDTDVGRNLLIEDNGGVHITLVQHIAKD